MQPDVVTDGQPPLLQVENLAIHFPVDSGLGRTKRVVRAVDGVSLEVHAGETVGVVGESGSGKTTLGYGILGHYRPTSGRIVFDGQDVTGFTGKKLRTLRRDMQMIFQDPYGSLNPRLRVEEIVGEPLICHRVVANADDLRQRVQRLLELCGMPADAAKRYPHAFSGGQRQRICVARALALEPRLVVADEPTSALDVSVQAQVINLLQDLQRELGLSYVFISHNLSVVRHVSHRIAIMYLGTVVEVAPSSEVMDGALHPYSQALLSAIPVADPDEQTDARVRLTGDIPSPINPPSGCRFHTRCPHAEPLCRQEVPVLEEKAPGHWVACHLVKRQTAVPVSLAT